MLFSPLCQRLYAIGYQEVVEQVFALALAKLLCLFANALVEIESYQVQFSSQIEIQEFKNIIDVAFMQFIQALEKNNHNIHLLA